MRQKSVSRSVNCKGRLLMYKLGLLAAIIIVAILLLLTAAHAAFVGGVHAAVSDRNLEKLEQALSTRGVAAATQSRLSGLFPPRGRPMPALHLATQENWADGVRALLLKGVPIDQLDDHGLSALSVAIMLDSREAMIALMEAGAKERKEGAVMEYVLRTEDSRLIDVAVRSGYFRTCTIAEEILRNLERTEAGRSTLEKISRYRSNGVSR